MGHSTSRDGSRQKDIGAKVSASDVLACVEVRRSGRDAAGAGGLPDHAVDLAAIPWNCGWALVDEFQAAAVLGLSPKTLRNYRLQDLGPRYLKLNGSAVRYRVADLQGYIEAQPSGGGSAQERRGPGRPRKASGGRAA